MSTDVIQITLTLKMTTAQVVETPFTVNNNSAIQDYVHPDDQTQPTFEMTPGFKPFTVFTYLLIYFFQYSVFLVFGYLSLGLSFFVVIHVTFSLAKVSRREKSCLRSMGY